MNTFTRILFLSLLVSFYILKPTAFADEAGLLSTANLKEIWFKDDEFADAAAFEAELQNETFERGSDIDNLIRAKYRMIGGDLKLAKFYLNRIDDKKSRVYPIKKRYLAIISFIEGHFDQSLEHLKDKHFYDNSIYPQICLLKLINFMAVNDTESLRREKESCMYYTELTSKNDAYWLDTMIKLKLKDQQGLKRNLITDVEKTLSDDEMSKLWLKTGLYLNKEKDLLNLLTILPESSYQSKRLREIIAFMYLRSNTPGDIQKALSFVDDIDSANAENIKGNINLQNKEYELAFGHFRLALQKKQDSNNSLERAIPLAWILNQWKDGLSMLENNTNKGLDPRNKRAVRVAFLIREKNFTEAERELTLLKIDFQNEPPFEVNIMDSYVSLIMGEKDKKFDKRKVEETTEKACRSFDGISCWISLQYIQWENLGKTIKRDEEIFTDKEMTIDSLKEKKVLIPLKETITVDQRDIEELDGSGIQLLKNNK
ncbi:MAG: hypothetical protein PHY93_04070 [Bacteriovorax sp.]|nr:hypothetical protein [Bacteriovorax sp.]